MYLSSQVTKNVSTEESLKIIEDAARNGVIVNNGTHRTVTVEQPMVSGGTQTLSSAVRQAAHAETQPKQTFGPTVGQTKQEVVTTKTVNPDGSVTTTTTTTTVNGTGMKGNSLGGAPGRELFNQRQAARAMKPMVDLTK
jgi:hypothetical protein